MDLATARLLGSEFSISLQFHGYSSTSTAPEGLQHKLRAVSDLGQDLPKLFWHWLGGCKDGSYGFGSHEVKSPKPQEVITT